jgi:hypothetical protein
VYCRLVAHGRTRHSDDEQVALLRVEGDIDAGGVAPGVAVDDEAVALVERWWARNLST